MTTRNTAVEWRRMLYSRTDVPGRRKDALYALSEYADWATGKGARPGDKKLMTDTGLEQRTVRQAIQDAIDLGLLKKVRGGHHGKAAEYDLRFPPPKGAR